MNRLFFVAVTLLATLASQASLIEVPLKEVVKDSRYVVIASLSDVKTWTKDGTDYGKGTLTISKVLSSKKPSDSKITLTWSNLTSIICPRIEYFDTMGDQYIWLLQRAPDGSVTADYPDRKLPIAEEKNNKTNRP